MAFSIALIVLLGLLSEFLLDKIKVPGLVGMLFVGMLLGPHALNIIRPELMTVSADFRMFALVVILLRAGLKIKKEALNSVGKASLLMSFLPSTMEGIAITLAAPHIFGLSYPEAAMLGFIVAAVSPAVIVPSMINFIENRMGAKKGIPTLVLASSSLDNAYVIVVFSAVLSMYASGDKGYFGLLQIPQSIALGVAVGLITGYILWKAFDRYSLRATKMTLVVMAVSLMLLWLEVQLKSFIAVSALLAVMATGFVLLEKAETMAHKISLKLSKVWIFAEIVLFVLVGAQVDVTVAWNAGLAGAIIIAAGLAARSIGTFIAVAGTSLSSRERLFCIVSYIPKATVQAAIGAVPLEAGVKGGDIILAVAVLSIILTAPLGAIGIQLAGKKWLPQE